MSLTDPDEVRTQYASEVNLETRRSVWRPGPSGIDPLDLVVDAVRSALPANRGMPDVLEVGCGTGAFAARLVEDVPGLALLAVDQSPRFVELTRERGVPAQIQDIQHLNVVCRVCPGLRTFVPRATPHRTSLALAPCNRWSASC